MRRELRVGLGLAVVYIVLAAVYVRVGDNPRPLFDGFAPVPPYNWVNPPPEFRAGNVVPRPSTLDVALLPDGSAAASGSSGDGQVILSFPAGAFPPRPPDVRVTVHMTPVDPAELAPPPAGLAADGNAYRLDFTYDPSGDDAPLVTAADVFLVVPEPAQTLLFSPDGRAWENLPFRPVPDPTQIGGAFPGAGYLLAVAPPVGRPSAAEDPESEASRLAKTAAATVALAAALAGAPVLWRLVRRRPAAPSEGSGR
ncbi:MAG: hypothetical protein ACLGI2_04970 [Acidimicrobiia bacterium]